jgi:hypothetical protein
MKTLRWLAIVTLVAGASLVACGDDDEDTAGGARGSGGGATGGTGGGETGGTGGGETGGTGGGETGGTGGGETGGTGGGETGGSAGEAGGAGEGGAAGAGGATVPPCVMDCITDDPAGWAALVDLMAPCVCEAGICDDVCADSFCTEPINYQPPAECANCALEKGQTDCTAELTACFGDTEVCAPFVTCLLACQQ